MIFTAKIAVCLLFLIAFKDTDVFSSEVIVDLDALAGEAVKSEAKFIRTALEKLPAWTEHSQFNKEDWDKYTELARRVQISDKRAVLMAFSEFSESAIKKTIDIKNTDDLSPESRIFILLRVVFELPNKPSLPAKIIYGSGYHTPNNDDVRGSSWPVRWTDGPELISPFRGREGLPYNGMHEYLDLLGKFNYRKLNGCN